MNKDQLIQFMQREGLWAKKGLGQNFLVDESALEKIVEAAELSENDTVLEIGPGLGVLTAELVQRVKKVVAVELDQKLAELLYGHIDILLKGQENNKTIQQYNNLTIVNGDALDFDPASLSSHPEGTEGSLKIDSSQAQNDKTGTIKKGSLQQGRNDKTANCKLPTQYKLVANIPYYITGKIIEKYLTAENRPSLIVLLVQKEVAERICAKPGQMSVLAFSVQLYGEPEIVSVVPASSFFPAPKVDSAILKIQIPENRSQITNDKELFKYVKMGFGSKRRTLVNNLSGGLHVSRENIEKILTDLNINPMARAQELSSNDWIELIKKLNRQ